MKLTVKLTAEQSADLPFPIGCPVWYYLPGKLSDELSLLKRGVVASVSFNMGEKDLIYEVTYKEGDGSKMKKIVDEVSEQKLAFGAQCPVTVECNNGEMVEGTVLLCRPSPDDPSKIVYTIMMMMEGCARYEEGIDAKRVKYRKVNAVAKDVVSKGEEDVPTSAERAEQTEAKSVVPSLPNNPSEAAEVTPEKETVPSSITCDDKSCEQSSIGKGTASSEVGHRPNNVSPPAANAANNQYNQYSHRSANSFSYDSAGGSRQGQAYHENRIEMKIPAWLQRNREVQRGLFFHLVGSKHEDKKHKRTVNHIERETNCSITVNLIRSLPRGDAPAPPMTITVEARSRTASAHRLLDEAREEIQLLLLDYLHFIRDEGAKGLLIYDVSSSCRGAHRPEESTSRAVRVKDPSGFDHYVSALDLPVDYADGVRSYHGTYILQKDVLGRIKNLTKCLVKVCGKHFGVPLIHCEPHVIVSGARWQDVDRAVDILKDETRRHMSNCSCGY